VFVAFPPQHRDGHILSPPLPHPTGRATGHRHDHEQSAGSVGARGGEREQRVGRACNRQMGRGEASAHEAGSACRPRRSGGSLAEAAAGLARHIAAPLAGGGKAAGRCGQVWHRRAGGTTTTTFAGSFARRPSGRGGRGGRGAKDTHMMGAAKRHRAPTPRRARSSRQGHQSPPERA